MSETWTDGNRLGGPLSELFAADVTTMVGRCDSCGSVRPMAEVQVFDRAPGLVARCPGCGSALLRLVRGPGRAWLDVRGLAYIELAITESTG